MKYFLTENGLEPFDMSAAELVSLLSRKRITDYKDIAIESPIETIDLNILYDVVSKMMVHQSFIFKHPSISFEESRNLILDRTQDKSKDNRSFTYATYIIQNLPDKQGICVVLDFDMSVDRAVMFRYKIHQFFTTNHRMNALERNLTIDTILTDLA